MRRRLLMGMLLLELMSCASPSRAEIVKTALMCDKGMCLYWWPKLPAPEGWHQDKDISYDMSVNMLVPDGEKFADTDSVIYATAIYKPRVPEMRTLDDLIASDRKEFLTKDAGMIIAEAHQLATADGQKLKTFIFTPQKKSGSWEHAAYGKEGDFYLIFILSSHSPEGYKKTMPVFEQLIARYRK